MFQVVDLIAEFFYSIFGNGIFIALVIIAVITLMLLSFRATALVILMVLIPLVIGFVLNIAFSNFLEIPAWILIALWISIGILMGAFFLIFTK